MTLTHLDLFSGIGGFALAAGWAGFRTVGFVEIDKYCQKVLNKHWPDVPVVEDIRDVETIKLITEIYGEGNPITLVTGGFPCQPFSVAGKQRGKSDNRYLWPEMFRVIREVRPRWVLGENVAGIVRMALDTALSDLEGIGYSAGAVVIPACGVEAPHERCRTWILAHTRHDDRTDLEISGDNEPTGYDYSKRSEGGVELARPGSRQGGHQDVAELRGESQPDRRGQGWWSSEPAVGRVAYGVPSGVDGLRYIGNAVVPQVAYQILKGIAKLEADGFLTNP